MTKPQNIYEALKSDPCMTTLVSLIDLAGLTDAVKGLKKTTLFAPSNCAFNKLPKELVEFLTNPENKETLQLVLLYHLTEGCLSSSKLQNNQILTMLNGGATTVLKDCKNINIEDLTLSKSKVYGKQTFTCGCNVVHKVCSVLIPFVF